MKQLYILFSLRYCFCHMEYIGIYHASASSRKQYFSSWRIIFNAAAFHIKKFHCPVPVPRYITPYILVKFCPRSDIGKIFFKTWKQFFLASSIKFNAMDIFHICSPAHLGMTGIFRLKITCFQFNDYIAAKIFPVILPRAFLRTAGVFCAESL